MTNKSKQRVQEYRERAAGLRAKTETMTDVKELNSAQKDADMWERMADWEGRNPPESDPLPSR